MSDISKNKASNLTREIEIVKITPEESKKIKDRIVCEVPLTIILNGIRLIKLKCSPDRLEYLALGFLLSEGLIKRDTRVRYVRLNRERWEVRIEVENEIKDRLLFFERRIASGCGGGIAFYREIHLSNYAFLEGKPRYFHKDISCLMEELQKKSLTFKITGGTHCCGLGSKKGIEVFAEDIGRHNAVDKVFGECFVKKVPTEDKIILTSGRVSSEILIKVASQKVPVIVSRSAPTDLAVELAEKLGVTLVGFARGNRMNIYTHPSRIV